MASIENLVVARTVDYEQWIRSITARWVIRFSKVFDLDAVVEDGTQQRRVVFDDRFPVCDRPLTDGRELRSRFSRRLEKDRIGVSREFPKHALRAFTTEVPTPVVIHRQQTDDIERR